jgi:hypothetical protein
MGNDERGAALRTSALEFWPELSVRGFFDAPSSSHDAKSIDARASEIKVAAMLCAFEWFGINNILSGIMEDAILHKGHGRKHARWSGGISHSLTTRLRGTEVAYRVAVPTSMLQPSGFELDVQSDSIVITAGLADRGQGDRGQAPRLKARIPGLGRHTPRSPRRRNRLADTVQSRRVETSCLSIRRACCRLDSAS